MRAGIDEITQFHSGFNAGYVNLPADGKLTANHCNTHHARL